MEDRDKLKFSAVERRPAFSALENNLNCSTLDKSFTAELGLSANLSWIFTDLSPTQSTFTCSCFTQPAKMWENFRRAMNRWNLHRPIFPVSKQELWNGNPRMPCNDGQGMPLQWSQDAICNGHNSSILMCSFGHLHEKNLEESSHRRRTFMKFFRCVPGERKILLKKLHDIWRKIALIVILRNQAVFNPHPYLVSMTGKTRVAVWWWWEGK